MDHLSALKHSLRAAESDLKTIDLELAVGAADGERPADEESEGDSKQWLDVAVAREPEVRELLEASGARS